MQAAGPDIRRSVNRLMLVAGVLLSLCLPLLWFLWHSQPLPDSECGRLSDPQTVCPSHTVWFYLLLVSASSQGTWLLMWLAGISGILITALCLLKRSPLIVRALVVVIVLAFAWYSFLLAVGNLLANPVFRHSDSITAYGRHYHLLEAKYPDGPSYQIVLGCDALGVRCEQLVVAGGLGGKPVDFPAFISQLP
jgi:hypothetical protein